MFSRRSTDADVAAAVARLYPGAPHDVAAAVLGTGERPRRGDAHVEAWVHEQVLRAAARLDAGERLASAAYPVDGDEALRVYLPDELADSDVAAVGAAAWDRARSDAWADHGDELLREGELWWAQEHRGEVDAVLARWRTG